MSALNRLAVTLQQCAADEAEINTYTEPRELMVRERQRTTFDVNQMFDYIYGSKEFAEKVRLLHLKLERDPAFINDKIYEITKAENRELTMKMVARIAELFNYDDTTLGFSRESCELALVNPSAMTRQAVHYGLLLNTIKSNGTPEQWEYWKSQGCVSLRKFYGCYAMTELGHGSNVAGLETTATFDPATDEFVIHTPNNAATKWWIGGAAHTANHAGVYAQLIINGKFHGVKVFMVPLRSRDDHSLLPGVTVGDIGKKIGLDGVDNGWIQFTNVRIPRKNMLMRFCRVSSDGKVDSPALEQLSYAGLLGGRITISYQASISMRKALTIAIRYASVRRQFAQISEDGKTENVILDYSHHQRRLLPLLSYCYGLAFASIDLYSKQKEIMDAFASGNPSQEAVTKLKELFTLTATLKGHSSWAAQDTIAECRQSLGGHGYSEYNGFGAQYNDYVVNGTWEGDNNILCLSAGASLLKSVSSAFQGKPLGAEVAYLAKYVNGAKSSLNDRDLNDPSVLVEAYEYAASSAMITSAQIFQNNLAKGMTQSQALERVSKLRFEAAKVHARQYVIKAFFSKALDAPDGLKIPLLNLSKLFALWSMENDSGLFLGNGFLQPSDVGKVTDLVTDYCKAVREQAIGYTDSFCLSDYVLNAPMGVYSGDVYKTYFEKVKSSNPTTDGKAPYNDSVLLPYLHRN